MFFAIRRSMSSAYIFTNSYVYKKYFYLILCTIRYCFPSKGPLIHAFLSDWSACQWMKVRKSIFFSKRKTDSRDWNSSISLIILYVITLHYNQCFYSIYKKFYVRNTKQIIKVIWIIIRGNVPRHALAPTVLLTHCDLSLTHLIYCQQQ